MPWALRTLLTISLVSLPLFIYIGVRVSGSIASLYPALRWRPYLVMVLVLAWLYILPATLALMSRAHGTDGSFLQGTAVTWQDFVFHYPFWIGLIAVLELTAPFLLLDIATIVVRLVPSLPQNLRTMFMYARIALAVLVVLYVAVRVVLDTAWVHDDVEHVMINRLPAELSGLTITLVSDIQVDRYTGDSKVGQVHRIIEAHHPDLLLSGGDLVTSGTDFLDEAKRAVSGIAGSVGTFAVMGDHDTWSAPEAIRDIHEECGWNFLDNEHRLFTYRGKSILVTGLTHVYSDRLAPAALRQFLSSAPPADLKMLLVHQPAEQVVRMAAESGYDLVLAGHTHGGQIVFHPLGIPFTPSMRETRYYQGVYKNGATTIVVTRGVGLTLAPVRYHAPSEVTTVVLEQEKK